MGNVERFDHDTEDVGDGMYISKMYSTRGGDYVLYEDYEALQDELIDLRNKLNKIEDMVKNLFMEF